MPGLKLKPKISKSAHFAKIRWDINKHKRDKTTGRFTFKPGTEEFKAEPFGPGKTSNVKSADIIKLHVTSNPKKAGSASHADFEQYKDDMTVGEFKALVGPKQAQLHLSHDTKKGFITIHDPATLPPKPLAEPEPPPPPKLTLAEYAITSKTSGVQPHDKIKLLAGSNPKKPGSKAAAAFSNYKDEMTVGEFQAALGGKKFAQEHLTHDLKKGFISIHNATDLADMQAGKLSPGTLAAQMQKGDKGLGVISKNPFTAGTKNYQDFEDAAFDQGLTTQAKVAASVDPATGAPKPKLADLADDDTIISQYGTNYSAKLLKADPDPVFKKQVEDNLANGKWTVKPKPPALKDTDKISVHSTSTGLTSSTKYSVAEYKTITGMTDSQVQANLASGKLKLHALEPVTTMKAGPSVTTPPPKPATKPVPAQAAADDDEVTTGLGNKFTVKEYKKQWSDNGYSEAEAVEKLNANIASGAIHVTKKTTYADDDVVESFMGNKYTIAQYKLKFGVADGSITNALKNGDIKLVPKITPTGGSPVAPVAEPAITKLSQVPKQDWDKYDVATISADNPYPQGSDKWVKFKKIHNTSSGAKSMTVTKYMSSTTLVDKQEVLLEQMVADGHVKFVTPVQKKAVADQKAKFAAQKEAAAKQAQVDKYKLHHEQLQPADWKNAPKWSKVPGVQDLGVSGKTIIMDQTRQALGLKFNSAQNPSVKYYTGTGNSTINGQLRGTAGYGPVSASSKAHMAKLDKLMEPTQGDAIMWRGIGTTGDLDNLNNMPPPSEFIDLGYSSMSHNPNVAQGFGGRSSITNRKTMFRIRVPAGTKAAYVSRRYSQEESMKDEAEVITMRGTRFKYISTTKNLDVHGTKIDVIEVEIVDEHGGNI